MTAMARLIAMPVCDRCLEGSGECHDKACTFWQTAPLTADQAAALDRQRQLYGAVRGVTWFDESG